MQRRLTLRTACFALILLLGLSFGVASAQGSNAQVIDMAATLNLRPEPTTATGVIMEIAGGTPLTVTRRTENSRWFEVTTPDGQSGWVVARFVELFAPISSIPTVSGPTPTAADAPAANTASTVAATSAQGSAAAGTARVRSGITLNLRQDATTASGVIRELLPETPLTVLGRNGNGSWLNVRLADGSEGWVAARYVANVSFAAGSGDGAAAADSTNAGGAAAQAPRPAGSAGNFAIVGDEISVAEQTYIPMGGYLNIVFGAYEPLRPAVEYFRGGVNSFLRTSQAAGLGYTTESVLDLRLANPAVCNEGETPLECELRDSQASIALIMLGNNDTDKLTPLAFRINLSRIVEITLQNGVTPALGTIPPALGDNFSPAEANAIIQDVAASYGVPVWDYGGPMHGLTNNGLDLNSNDWPSFSAYLPDHITYDEGYGYGYQLFNLMVMQTLDQLWRQGLA